METFERDGLVFDLRQGGPSDGRPVVLLHGFPEDASCWEGVEPALHAAGYRTLAPHQRGYSPGARPPGRGAARAAGVDRAHVVGHDMGGLVAWQLAARHPERVRTLTSVSTPHPRAFLRSLLTSNQALRSWYMFALQIPWLPERVAGARGGATGMRTQLVASGLPEDLARRYLERLSQPGALTAALNWYRAMPLVSPRRLSSTVAVPTLYVWSTRDWFLAPKPAELTARYVTGPYRFEVMEGVSHWIPETEPDPLASLLLDHFHTVDATG